MDEIVKGQRSSSVLSGFFFIPLGSLVYSMLLPTQFFLSYLLFHVSVISGHFLTDIPRNVLY